MVRFLKLHTQLFLVTAVLISLFGCTPLEKNTATPEKNATENGIAIGVFESASGFNSSTGGFVIQGIQLAQEMYPTVLDRPIQLILRDAKSDDVATVEAVKQLVEKDKVAALIGSTSSTNSIAASPFIAQYHVPTVGATCTNPLVTAGNLFYSRVCFIDSYQGAAMANYLYHHLKIRKVAIIRDHTNDYAIGLSNYFIKAFVELTGSPDSVVLQANYARGDTNFTAQLTSVKAAKVDAIFAPGGDIESALMIQQARDMGLKIPIAGGDSWESDVFLQMGGTALDGVLLSTMFTTEHPVTSESKRFITAYQKRYGQMPSSSAALGYDAYLVIYKALKKSGSTDPDILNTTIRHMNQVEGATGVLSFDENGNAINSVVIKQVKKGLFTYTDTIKP